MLNASFWVFFNEDFIPQVLDEGFREKFVANSEIVISEGICKEKSVFSVRFTWKLNACRAEEEKGHHFNNTSFGLIQLPTNYDETTLIM